MGYRIEKNTGRVMKVEKKNGKERIRRATVSDIKTMTPSQKVKYATRIKNPKAGK